MAKSASSTNNLNFNQQTSSKPVRSSDDIIFQTLIRDPIKKAFLLNLLASEKENIKKYKQQQENNTSTPIPKRRKFHCESPTALLRRKALEKNVEQSSPSTSCSPSTPVQFDKLLQGVVAYVEIRSKGIDRSAGAKTLMQSMGAKVVEKLERGVTHVVFKDSTFTTYQKAKLLRAHLVSVLWLEAVRKNNYRVPEKNYPALGMESYDVNVSEMFLEYETVVDEEYRRSMAVGTTRNTFESERKRRLTSIPSELASHRKRSCSTTSRRVSSYLIPSSQDFEVESIISSRGILTSRTDSEISATEEFTSDDDSHCGVINGRTFSQFKQSLLCNLETQLNNYDERVHNGTEYPSNQNFENDYNNESRKNNQSNIMQIQNDISINNDQTVSTSSSRSASLLSRKSIVSEKTINVTADMDLTRNITSNETNVQDQNPKTKILPFGNESVPNLLNKNKLISQSMRSNYNDKPPLFNIVVTDTSPPKTQRFSIPANRNSVPMRISSGLSSSQKGTRNSNTLRMISPQSAGYLQSNLVHSLNSIDKVKNKGVTSPFGTGLNSVGIRKSARLSKSIVEPPTKATVTVEQSPKITKPSTGNAIHVSSLKLRTNNKKSLQREPRNGSGEPRDEFKKSTDLSKLSSEIPNSTKTPESTKTMNQNNEVKERTKYTRITKLCFEDSSSDDELVKDSKQTNNADVRRSPRVSNFPFINNIELTDDSSKSNLARSTDSDSESNSDSSRFIRGRRSFRGNNLQAPNTSPQSKSIQSSSDDTQNNVVPPLQSSERDLSKNSENMPTLRISADSAGKRVSSSEPKENSENAFRRSSRTPSSLPKNSETIPSLRISADSTGKCVSSSEPKENNSKNALRRSSRNSDCLSKNSENIQSLRISADSAGKRVSSSEPKENSENAFRRLLRTSGSLPKNSETIPSLRISADSAGKCVSSSEPKENNSQNALRRSSRKSACLSKNNETMPSMPVSLESSKSFGKRTQPTRTSTRLNRSGPKTPKNLSPKEKDTKKANISRKKIRKLYNLNQTPSQVRALARKNADVEAIPVPVFNPNAKTLIVPLTQLVLPENGKTILKKKIFHKTKKKAAAITQSSPTVETEENVQELVDEDGKNDKRSCSLSNLNNAPQMTQLTISGSRRSTLEFVENTGPKRKIQFVKRTVSSIVCTRMHKPETQIFNDAVRKLGKFFVENDVTEKTTHLVVGECKRTVNLLKAISRGCWILRKDWLFKSITDGKWLQEEDYELTDFSPAVKVCRTERQAFGNLYSMDIFNDCDPIYVSVNSNPKRVDLIELINLCKGTVVTKRSDAKIVIAEFVDGSDVKCVTEKWVLDSITFNKKKSLNKYLIRSTS